MKSPKRKQRESLLLTCLTLFCYLLSVTVLIALGYSLFLHFMAELTGRLNGIYLTQGM